MPKRAPSPCHVCGVLVAEGGRCAVHRAQQQRAVDERRGNSADRGYDSKWRRYRLDYLRSHPLCVECERQGRVEPATDVDHIVPHRGDRALCWQHDNHQGLCASCHSRKTAREDGGFGHAIAIA